MSVFSAAGEPTTIAGLPLMVIKETRCIMQRNRYSKAMSILQTPPLCLFGRQQQTTRTQASETPQPRLATCPASSPVRSRIIRRNACVRRYAASELGLACLMSASSSCSVSSRSSGFRKNSCVVRCAEKFSSGAGNEEMLLRFCRFAGDALDEGGRGVRRVAR